jgi:alpha-1,3-rhamnosyl/mannosyltransferase
MDAQRLSTPVTLCVDALSPQLSGIGRYTWELSNGLAGHRGVSPLRFYRSESIIDDVTLLRQEHSRRKRSRLSQWLDSRRSGRVLKSTLVHGPNYFLPLAAERGVITVHDLSVFAYPQTHPSDRLKAFERLFASSLNRAVHIITDTETVRCELIEAFSLRPEAISAVCLGVGPSFVRLPGHEISSAIKQWDLTPGNYGLSVAAFEPRKKIAELIAAWERLPAPLRLSCPLVLAGAAGWRNEELHDAIANAQSQGWLKHLGFVDEAQLPKLYAGARLFVYPSIYEGFGLPPIEAMASGTPVVVSNRSCLPEVCGDAAHYIDPDDPEGFTSAIEEILSDEHKRVGMIFRGLARAQLYSWDRCVGETVAVYKNAWSQIS